MTVPRWWGCLLRGAARVPRVTIRRSKGLRFSHARWGPRSPTAGDTRGVQSRRAAKMGDDIEDLRERAEFYRAMFEANTASKRLIDPSDGQIIDANPAAAAFYGWPLEEFIEM